MWGKVTLKKKKNKIFLGAVQMIRWITHLPQKPENQSSNAQNPQVLMVMDL